MSDTSKNSVESHQCVRLGVGSVATCISFFVLVCLPLSELHVTRWNPELHVLCRVVLSIASPYAHSTDVQHYLTYLPFLPFKYLSIFGWKFGLMYTVDQPICRWSTWLITSCCDGFCSIHYISRSSSGGVVF